MLWEKNSLAYRLTFRVGGGGGGGGGGYSIHYTKLYESSRPKRVGEAVKNELTILLLQQVADPRLSGVAISRVVVTPDLKQAKVYFTVPPGIESKAALKGMQRAKGFFRSHLAKVLNVITSYSIHYTKLYDCRR